MQTKPRNLERYETFLYQNKERVRTASLKRGLVTNAPPPSSILEPKAWPVSGSLVIPAEAVNF